MGNCVSPFQKEHKNKILDLPCGKCYQCKARRISGWSFRLMKEAEVSSSAFFLTLTYDTESVPITKKGFMTLDKTDLQKFLKRLRKINNEKLKYYACGEYGGKTKRPHYHMVIFNADQETFQEAWTLNGKEIGSIYVGTLTEASVGYTLKYMAKESKIPEHQNDDRQKEFALMSKKMGSNYIDKFKTWHKESLKERMYLNIEGGKKIAMPRYYKEKIYTEQERKKIANYHVARRDKEFKDRWEGISNQQFINNVKEEQKNEHIAIWKQTKAQKDKRNTTL